MTPEQTLDWLAQQHFDQCREKRLIQDWIRKMKSQLPEQEPVEIYQYQMGNGSWIDQDQGSYRYNKQHGHTVRIVYSTPPQRTWVGLSTEDKNIPYMGKYVVLSEDWIDGYKTGLENADAKLREMNEAPKSKPLTDKQKCVECFAYGGHHRLGCIKAAHGKGDA